jgi:hypothetical protein
MERLKIDSRYKKAVVRATWFSGTIAIGMTIVAIMALIGVVDRPSDAPIAGAIALCGGVMFIAGIVVRRLLRF